MGKATQDDEGSDSDVGDEQVDSHGNKDGVPWGQEDFPSLTYLW